MVSDPKNLRPGLRYEIKMACQEAAYERIVACLRMDPAAVRELYPRRQVQSVYLDTTFGRALSDNLAGISHREKIRLRWYGPDARGVRATLERKVRENMLGWKDTLRFDDPIDIEGVDRNDFISSLRERATPEWRSVLDAGLEPVQWISYQRDYLVTSDLKVRITLDRSLRATDLRDRFVLSSARPTPLPRLLIVEAKCAESDYGRAQELVSRQPLFVDRCSKFVLASTAEHGPHPSVFPL